ncbi:MAG: dipeptidase [Candidatus Brocadiia bacterium]
MKTFVDFHCDSILFTPPSDHGLPDSFEGKHWDIGRALKAHQTLQVMAMFTTVRACDTHRHSRNTTARILSYLELLRRTEESRSNVVFVRWSEDLDRLDGTRLGLLASMEDATPIAPEDDILPAMFRLGLRAIGFCWQGRNAFGDGAMVKRPRGLTERGKRLVRECEALKVLVDLSHLTPKGVDDVLSLATRPVIASHSNAKAICGSPRNLSDEHIKAIAASGGVIGINFFPTFLSDSGEATIDDILRHISHIASVGGIGCVGLGADLDGVGKLPAGISSVLDEPPLREVLKKQLGLSEAEADGVMGGNWMRLLRTALPSRKKAFKA